MSNPMDHLSTLLQTSRRVARSLPRWGRAVRRSGLLHLPRPRAVAAVGKAALRSENIISLSLRYQASHTPTRTAIEDGDHQLSYAALDRRVDQVARTLQARGILPGHSVAVMLSNSVEFFEVMLAIARMGANLTPMSDKFKAREVNYILEHSDATALIVDHDRLEVVEARWREALRVLVLRADADPPISAPLEDYAEITRAASAAPLERRQRHREGSKVIMYTSGTTGRPKGAQRRIRSLTPEGLLNTFAGFDFKNAERLYICTPLYHAAPWAMSSFVLGLGGTIILSKRWRGADTLAALEATHATTFLVVPTLVRRWLDLDSPQRPPALEKVISAGARFPAQWKREATERLGEVFYDFYGATELGIITIASPSDAREAPESVGKVLPHIDVKLLLEGREVAPGEPGELYARGQNFSGYLKNEAASEANSLDGYFSVGDIATLDGRGYLYIVDRRADMVVSGGVNIYPAEVEGVLRDHPDVNDVAVVGLPHPEFGEALHAFVVSRPGRTPDEAGLIAHCGEELARFKKPRGVTFLDALPRSPQGKVLKRELVARFSDPSDVRC